MNNHRSIISSVMLRILNCMGNNLLLFQNGNDSITWHSGRLQTIQPKRSLWCRVYNMDFIYICILLLELSSKEWFSFINDSNNYCLIYFRFWHYYIRKHSPWCKCWDFLLIFRDQRFSDIDGSNNIEKMNCETTFKS